MNKYLKSIHSLMDRRFTVPKFQRGYRWGKNEVTDLLDDLWEFANSNAENAENAENAQFYCLQPLVTINDTKTDTSFVLDGQQRLTTIYLLLSFLEDQAKDDYQFELFSIDYESRPFSKEYLEERKFKTEEVTHNNVDFHQMSEAYRAIEEWFGNQKDVPEAKKKITSLLLEEDNQGPNVRVIEYSPEGDNPTEVFLRLNSGKIPLTDSELVKALLLQRDLYRGNEAIQITPYLDTIAKEWNDIELTLNNDKLWAFISPNKDYPDTRIELLLEQVAQEELKRYHKANADEMIKEIWSKRATPCFYSINSVIQLLIEQKKTREQAIRHIWEHIIMVFERICEWYSDNELYHYIGFLSTINNNCLLQHFIELSSDRGISAFKEELKREIGETIKDIDIPKLTYTNPSDKPICTKILLLHNVDACIMGGKEQARFPFDLYASTKEKEKWSLEHIHAQQSDVFPGETKEQIEWLKAHSEFMGPHDEISKLTDQDHEKIQEMAKKLFDGINNGAISDDHRNGLCNLCLLDKATNSSISNDLFPLKRAKIIEIDQQGKYIPLATKRAFMKAYTPHSLDNIRWTESDASAYLESIMKTIEKYK